MIKQLDAFLRRSEASMVNERYRAAFRVCEMIFAGNTEHRNGFHTWDEINRLAFFAVGREDEWEQMVREREIESQRLEYQCGLLGVPGVYTHSSRGPDYADTIGQDSQPNHPEPSDQGTEGEGARRQAQVGVRDDGTRQTEIREPAEDRTTEERENPSPGPSPSAHAIRGGVVHANTSKYVEMTCEIRYHSLGVRHGRYEGSPCVFCGAVPCGKEVDGYACNLTIGHQGRCRNTRLEALRAPGSVPAAASDASG